MFLPRVGEDAKPLRASNKRLKAYTVYTTFNDAYNVAKAAARKSFVIKISDTDYRVVETNIARRWRREGFDVDVRY